MGYDIEHVRTQHPVGQGSFHSASVTVVRPSGRYRFDYVYDCGGLTSRGRRTSAVKAAVEAYSPRQEQRVSEDGEEVVSVIDALILSHFDYDHINGAKLLAAKCEVTRIYAPYLSPIEMALEISRQAHSVTGPYLDQLFSVANGGSLWGVPVTRVQGGPGDGPNDLDNPTRRPKEPNQDERFNDEAHRSPFPGRMQAVVTSTGATPGDVIEHARNLALDVHGERIWQLRFWNHQVPEEMLFYTWTFLDAVGFPLQALKDPNGAAAVLAWLATKKNRDDAVDAYVAAFRLLGTAASPLSTAEHVPNLISLGLFSGPWPWARPTPTYNYTVLPPYEWHDHFWPYFDELDNVGWLGTGDALLGEPDIWADFSAHYSAELPRVQTVLLPHHGAAPVGGPAFYHPGLNHRRHIQSVISAGARNRYGHPREEVLTQVRKLGGHLQIVTETWERGFREFAWIEI
ncbi:MBL fold metallo-hydrolase [Roseateles noduli]|uniref:MBL fold metallo-hydrolase n=1 Tax=Roseateles noduli TaxID=2052484 RepID=UPI003D64E3C1